jgi:hypothetical protein
MLHLELKGISKHLSTSAGASYLLGKLMQEVERLSKTPLPIDPLNPLLKEILSWPECDIKIPYPPIDSKWLTSTHFSLAIIEKMRGCFAIEVAILEKVLKGSKNMAELRPILELINDYEPLKEALKPTALKLSIQLQLFWDKISSRSEEALTLFDKILEEKKFTSDRQQEDYQLFLGEIVTNNGKINDLQKRYDLLFPTPIPDEDL